MNISNFIVWFINSFVSIARNMIGIIDNMIIFGNVSLLDLIITLVIIGAFIEMIITVPAAANREIGRQEMYKAKRDTKTFRRMQVSRWAIESRRR